MNCYPFRAALLLILVALVSGCGRKSHPPVSGKVTMDGEPVPSIRVVFSPVGSAAAPVPGPYSTAVTDEQGNYTLATRHGDAGAVAGPHRVGIDYEESNGLIDLQGELVEASAESKASIQKKIDELRVLLKSRIKVPANSIFPFEVPKEGTSSADFELNAK